jgi:hypothetical protein
LDDYPCGIGEDDYRGRNGHRLFAIPPAGFRNRGFRKVQRRAKGSEAMGFPAFNITMLAARMSKSQASSL